MALALGAGLGVGRGEMEGLADQLLGRETPQSRQLIDLAPLPPGETHVDYVLVPVLHIAKRMC